MKVKVLGKVWDGKRNQYGSALVHVAKVIANYKADATVATTNKDEKEQEYILIKSPTHSCGVRFSRGEWIVSMTAVPNEEGAPSNGGVYEPEICGYARKWKLLTNTERSFLDTRMICDKEGICMCGDGSYAKMCKMSPCMKSTCQTKGATCLDNYCGGCRAEWVDLLGGQLQCQCMKEDNVCQL